mmetsp:Transcript_1629/g.4216  ORF Transcript_1629/g.4216 Transcript_1629/m.4216 type:complete len:209 (-) Transcript_1629:311-937(-)
MSPASSRRIIGAGSNGAATTGSHRERGVRFWEKACGGWIAPWLWQLRHSSYPEQTLQRYSVPATGDSPHPRHTAPWCTRDSSFRALAPAPRRARRSRSPSDPISARQSGHRMTLSPDATACRPHSIMQLMCTLPPQPCPQWVSGSFEPCRSSWQMGQTSSAPIGWAAMAPRAPAALLSATATGGGIDEVFAAAAAASSWLISRSVSAF